MTTKTVYNVADLCNMLSIGRTTVYQLLKEKKIPSIRLGKRYIVPINIFNEWLEKGAKYDNQ